MTKHRFFAALTSAQPKATALALLLALPLGGLQAQGLKPFGGQRLPNISPSVAVVNQGSSANQQADFIVVLVNSEPITNNELRTRLIRTELQLQQQRLAVPTRNELLPQLLERMIIDKVQLQTAVASGLRVDDNAIEAAILSIANQNRITVEELRRRLKIDKIDYTQFRSELRDELLVTRLRQREVDTRVNVTELDIDEFLRGQVGKSGAGGTLMLNLAEILVPVPENATPVQVAALQAKAQQVLARARAGGDFVALATEFSTSAARSNGRPIGLRSAERYPPLFIEATLNVPVGELAEPIRSGAGFHILKVLEKKQGSLSDVVVTQIHARHILLRLTAQLNEAAAIAKLAGFKQRIQAGQADFAALARENSQDGSAKEGGDLGWANPGMFVPEFEKVMNALMPNQVSDPLVSRFGVHLIQVLERREAPLSEREQREIAREQLREKKQAEAYAVWIQELRGRAYIELRESPQ